MIMRMFDDEDDHFFSEPPDRPGLVSGFDDGIPVDWRFIPLQSQQILTLEEAHNHISLPQMLHFHKANDGQLVDAESALKVYVG